MIQLNTKKGMEMYLRWNQNGVLRVWNLSAKGTTRKLRNSLKKAVGYGPIFEALSNAKTIADMHYLVYGLKGTSEFKEFEITSTAWDV